MRLIDADELRKRAVEMYQGNGTDFEIIMMVPLCDIDNAPTYNQVGHKMATAEGFITNPEWYKGDLISRESLRKDIEHLYSIYAENKDGFYTDVIDHIDNAPTVEPCYQTTSCLDCKMYDKGKHNCPRFCEVIRSAIEERPQGEWIKIGELGLAYKCNKCEEVSVTPENFCPNCGADMQKGDADMEDNKNDKL